MPIGVQIALFSWFVEPWFRATVAMAGLLVAIYGAYQAYQARSTAGEARDSVRRAITVKDLRQTVDGIGRIKDLYYEQSLSLLQGELRDIRFAIIDIREKHLSLSPESRKTLGRAILTFRKLQNHVEAARLADDKTVLVEESVDFLNEQAETLIGLAAKLEAANSPNT
ncbi:MAG: hypothetical protein JJ896_08980 [Rhodothermales bacterium]|nr:hypothetical protein [Rhodothermales bacterium]MBO6779771.1 hypothetical protein [Rhodothermales bacterium]